MQIINISIFVINIIILCTYLYVHINKKKQLYNQFNKKEKEYQQKLNEYNSKITNLNNELYDYTKQISEKKQELLYGLTNLKTEEKSKLLAELNLLNQQREELKTSNKNLTEELDKLNEWRTDALEKKIQLDQKISISENTLNALFKKQQAINQSIAEQKENYEKENFNKLNLTLEEVEDLEQIKKIRNHFNNQEFLSKAIYECYLKTKLSEMTKRVLKGKPSGIYKITRLTTGEIYIGKSTDVSTRWQQHIKSALGIGTISHQTLHTLMLEDGFQNFTFELLEEVPKDQLTEREKFYINFYESDKYGLNMKKG